MRVKVPQTLVTFPKDDKIVVYNYLTKDAVIFEPQDVYWLTIASTWISIDELINKHSHIDPSSLRREIERLVEVGVLLEENSKAASKENDYRQMWEFGIAAGIFHCSILDNEYSNLSASVANQKERAAIDPSPELYWKNSENSIVLPGAGETSSSPLFDIMSRRRTNRNAKHEFITLQHLSECLYAGLGVTGFVKTETAVLPLKMTPSGGARNPFEAFVWVRDVEGLAPGVYHYSALEHSLESVDCEPSLSPMEMVQGQDWANDMPAIIFLVAVLRRTMWKYNDPNAYRVVLIEAGHIAQNMMLACANNYLTACPTAALRHSEISEMLGLSDITESPIYALLVGKPGENTDTIMPNTALRRCA
jgi:SagB-type dehydrogenase family enzyme